MGRKPKFSKKQFLAAIEGSGGIVLLVARRLSCHPQTVNEYLNRDPELREQLDREKECMIDAAESTLMNLIKKGSIPATIFFLKTRGRDRGYSEIQLPAPAAAPTIRISPEEAEYFQGKSGEKPPESQPDEKR